VGQRKVTDQDLTVLEAFILGVTQGLTEFLPVSSSGHLVLVPELFNLSTPTLGFDIVLHLATLLAVLAYFMRDVRSIVVALVAPVRMSRPEVMYWRRLFTWLVIGSVPAAIAGFGFSRFFEGLFDSTLAVGIFLLVTSALLFGSDFALGRVRSEPAQLGKMRAADALIVGCFQALAIAPGLSRSGSTMAAGVFLGFDRPSAARFSFLLSIPAILGAFLASLGGLNGGFAGAGAWAYIVGAIAAALTGFFAVALLMRYVKNHRLRLFAIYAAVLGVFVIIISAV
jgi:undecaprenyl-diphosphatase